MRKARAALKDCTDKGGARRKLVGAARAEAARVWHDQEHYSQRKAAELSGCSIRTLFREFGPRNKDR